MAIESASDRPTRQRPRLPRWALETAERGAHTRRPVRVLGPPPVCPIERAMGDHTPCAKEECVFYKVPGTRMDCAVQQWAPTAGHDPEVAHWFLDLRRLAE